VSRARAVGLLVAAGSGERLGAGVSKALVEVAGAPLLVHAARALAACRDLEGLVVVVAEAEVDRAAKLLADAGVTTRAVVAGGAERHASVARGLEALGGGDALVAVHDAARPLVTPELVSRTVSALVAPWAAVAPALPVVDTLKLAAEDGRVLRTLDRRGLWAVQTPQVFPRDVLARAHARQDPAGATDDLMLVERAGGRVRLVEGDRLNVKVTYPDDLELVAAVLAARSRR
jgi:2-C-methyl-D-erythritol 4-phosphate cytidylyltransferase